MNATDNKGQNNVTHHYVPVNPGSNGLMYFMAGILVVAFGAVCVFGGLYFMRTVDRLENSEKQSGLDVRDLLAMQKETFLAILNKEPSGQLICPPPPQAPAPSSQPQIYFIGQTGPAAMPVAMPVSMPMTSYPGGMPSLYQPQIPPFMQPDVTTELNRFIMTKYQNEFNEYIRERTMAAPSGGYTPVTSVNLQDVWKPGFSNTPVSMRREYINSGISVPEKMTVELKRRYSSKPEVEDWLHGQTAANREMYGDDFENEGEPDPQMDAILRSLAESTFADEQYERTARVYAELASRSVNLTVPELMRWAKACELAGDVDAALRILNLILKIDRENPAVLREAAQIAVAHDKFAVAAEYYGRLVKADPNEREWRKMRAKTLTWADRGREAVDLMRTLHNEDPEDWELNLMLADLLLSLHEFADALPVIDLLIANAPEDESLYVRKMNALMATQSFKEAAEINAVLVQRHPEDMDLVLKLAVNLVAANEFVAAIAPFETYLAEKPDDIEVRKQFAEDLMAAQRFQQAATEYKKLLPHDTAEQSIRKKLANAYMAAEDYYNASEIYGQLVMMFPSDREMNTGYVVSLRLSGQIDQALAAAMNYLLVNPYDHKILVEAASMAMEMKQVKRAVEWYRTAVRLMPSDYKSRIALGNGLVWMQEYEQAESQFRQALCFCASDFMGRRGLARALFYQRKYKESFKIYKQMTWDDPTGPICLEYKFRMAIADRQEVEAARILVELQAAEPEDITWKSDRYQGLLRQHRFPEARAQAKVIFEQEPDHKPTMKGLRATRRYLTTRPVEMHWGLLRKSSKETEDEVNDRRAKLTYSYFGFHGEQSINPYWRVYADADREHWNMRESGVSNAISYRFRAGAMSEGNPNLRFKGDLGYRWFIGSDKQVLDERRGIDDQWLYNLRGELIELGRMPLNIGFFSGRREHYDNYNNVYDDLYAYDFGIDAHYARRKWDFNLELVGSTLTDTNSRFFTHVDGKYRLYETPCMLMTVGGNIEYESFRETMPTYYSPRDMYKYGVDIDGRYYFCRDPETWGSTQSYLDFGMSFYRDRFKSNGQKFYLGVSHDYSRRFSAFARVDFTKESYYNEVKLLAGLTYKFGGCE